MAGIAFGFNQFFLKPFLSENISYCHLEIKKIKIEDLSYFLWKFFVYLTKNVPYVIFYKCFGIHEKKKEINAVGQNKQVFLFI